MKHIVPYSSKEEAIKSLDNGGRFYNILTSADDGVISKEEIGKVGGLFHDKQQMILFLELSISSLCEEDRDLILSKLDTQMMSNYQAHRAHHLLPSEAEAKGVIADNTVLTGIPKLVETKEDFSGFIMVPILIGKVTSFSMIPIFEHYDVYEIRNEHSDDYFLITHSKGLEKLPNKKIKIAGVLKELKTENKDKRVARKFLEALYWM